MYGVLNLEMHLDHQLMGEKSEKSHLAPKPDEFLLGQILFYLDEYAQGNQMPLSH